MKADDEGSPGVPGSPRDKSSFFVERGKLIALVSMLARVFIFFGTRVGAER